MSELVVPIIGLIGVILGIGASELRSWLMNKEQYRILTFEKRLKTHQEAFYMCYQLRTSFLGFVLTHKATDEQYKITHEAHKWWENNCLLLDESSRQKMSESIDKVGNLFLGLNNETPNNVLVSLQELRAAITKGIGIKHLPEILKDDRQPVP